MGNGGYVHGCRFLEGKDTEVAQPRAVSGWRLTPDNWKPLRSNVGRKCLKGGSGLSHVAKHGSKGDSAARGVSPLGLDGMTCGINMHVLRELFRSSVSQPLHLCKD